MRYPSAIFDVDGTLAAALPNPRHGFDNLAAFAEISDSTTAT
jgi:hypothetical protein